MADDALAMIRQTFFVECDELLSELEAGLLDLKDETAEQETVNAVFRAVHSIKGGAGAFHLNDLVQFAHGFETALDHLRSGRLAPTPNCMKVFLRANDALADLVRAARDGLEGDAAQWRGLLEELGALAGVKLEGSRQESASEREESDSAGVDFQPIAISIEDILAGGSAGAAGREADGFVIRFRPFRELYAKANEAVVLLRELARLGEAEIICDASAVPPLSELDPEGAYLSWTIVLKTEAEEQTVRHIFEFVESDCELEILARASTSQEDFPLEDIQEHALSATSAQIQAESVFTDSRDSSAPRAPHADAEERASVAEHPAKSSVASTTIRVDVERVDRFVDLIGELVINQAMLAQKINETGLTRGSPIAVGLDEIERLLRAIQDSAMAIRAQPVKSVFQRMSRVLREAADATGKSVHLVTEGENAEVDKTIIERLTDPLTHMIRNAVDHGIESPEKREASGKTPEGVVKLSAHHRSGRIVIEVADDGSGIDRERVKEIAVRKGLISQNALLTDDEIDDLIFHPGFSTAQSVSDMSGRGVGMDVVRRSIQALGGRIGISSRRGEGSTFSLSLPLTLAVLDGMVVTVSGQTLVLPLAAIVETMMPKSNLLQDFGSDALVILVRDEVTPVIDLGVELGYRNRLRDFSSAVVILVESERGGRRALLVDGILDQRQIVIKSLEGNYGAVPGIAAATILGDGRVALIVDVDAIAANNGSAAKSLSRLSSMQVSA